MAISAAGQRRQAANLARQPLLEGGRRLVLGEHLVAARHEHADGLAPGREVGRVGSYAVDGLLGREHGRLVIALERLFNINIIIR